MASHLDIAAPAKIARRRAKSGTRQSPRAPTPAETGDDLTVGLLQAAFVLGLRSRPAVEGSLVASRDVLDLPDMQSAVDALKIHVGLVGGLRPADLTPVYLFPEQSKDGPPQKWILTSPRYRAGSIALMPVKHLGDRVTEILRAEALLVSVGECLTLSFRGLEFLASGRVDRRRSPAAAWHRGYLDEAMIASPVADAVRSLVAMGAPVLWRRDLRFLPALPWQNRWSLPEHAAVHLDDDVADQMVKIGFIAPVRHMPREPIRPERVVVHVLTTRATHFIKTGYVDARTRRDLIVPFHVPVPVVPPIEWPAWLTDMIQQLRKHLALLNDHLTKVGAELMDRVRDLRKRF